MTAASWPLFCAALVALGCVADETDTSGGGGTGGDPTADPDADHLSNEEEESYGSDPLVPDTDGDGYLDGDEVLEGSDPVDPASVIYTGGWPYQRDKDQIVDPGFEGAPVVGGVIPRFVAYDQYGQLVDLYDFAMHDRPVVIDMSALWCEACRQMALWLEGEPSIYDDNPELAPVRELVDDGSVYWVTVIFEDGSGNAAEPQHAVAWSETFPNPAIPVLADNERQMFDYLYPGLFPNITVVNADMTIRAYDRFDYKAVLLTLL